MPELIDKAKLLEYLAAIKPDEYVSTYGEAAVDVINHVETYVSEMPTIEAEPVRRGHWVLTRDEQYEYCHCSECGYDTGENWMIGSEIPYCSQCGSKNYDGGAENDT